MRNYALIVASMLVLAFGCGDDGGRTETDAGPISMTDGGPGTDGGGAPVDGGGAAVDGGGGTIDPSTMCPAGACDLLNGTGCAEGEGCYFGAMSGGTPAPICVPAGAGVDGAACTNINDCAPGLTCADGACRHVCCGTNDSNCPAATGCTPLRIDGSEVMNFGACLPNMECDLFDQSGCEEGEGCYPVPGGAGCLTPADPPVAVGGACEAGNECAPGAVCVGGTCATICNREADPSTCPEMAMCQGVTNFPENVGFCPPPGT